MKSQLGFWVDDGNVAGPTLYLYTAKDSKYIKLCKGCNRTKTLFMDTQDAQKTSNQAHMKAVN